MMRCGRKTSRESGFTLIELMIAVVVVGILAAIAYPSYRNYITQTRRSDAQTILLRAAALQEKYYADCSTYASSLAGTTATCPNQLGMGATNPFSNDGYYKLTLGPGNLSGCTTYSCGYTITADPVTGRGQEGDGALRIDGLGTRQWNRKGGGTWVSWTSK